MNYAPAVSANDGCDGLLYHYCSGGSARTIMGEDPPSFNAGLGDFGVGVYATDIAPEDAATPAHVNRVCFDGGRDVAALDHVFVLHRASREQIFDECAPHQ